MIHAGGFHRRGQYVSMIFCEFHTRELSLRNVFTRNAIAFDQLAAFVVPAILYHFCADSFVDFGIGFFGVAELLAQESYVIVDLDNSALRPKVLYLIGHVARSVANCATRLCAKRSAALCWLPNAS